MENTKQTTSAQHAKLRMLVDSTYILHRTAETVDAINRLLAIPTASHEGKPIGRFSNWVPPSHGCTTETFVGYSMALLSVAQS
jgi:hypothetical protein